MSPRDLIVAAGLLAALPSAAFAGTVTAEILPAAQVSQAWAAQMDDPRLAALGGAGAVLSEGLSSLQGNPGGLDSLVDPELSFSHHELSTELGLRLEDLSAGRRWGDGVVAGGLRYSGLGSFEDRDASGASLGAANEAGYAGSLGYGQSFWSDSLHTGLALGGSQETLSGQSFSQFTASAGAIYRLYQGFRLGVALMNLKLSGDGASDSSQRLGLGWVSSGRALKLAGEWHRMDHGDGTLRAGAELTFAEDYDLRVGWRSAMGPGSQEDSGFTAGAGVQLGGVRIDYAYAPYGVFGASQRLGATINLSEGLFGNAKIVIEATGSSLTAQADYKDGMEAYARKDWYEARASLKNVLKVYPGFKQAAEVRQTLAELDRKISADRASGTSKETRTAFGRKLSEAKELMQRGQLVQARKKLDEVAEFDPNLKEGLDLRKRLNDLVQAKTSHLKQQAQADLASEDLASATALYRQVLALDGDDKEARDRLVRLRPRILTEITQLHRQGIDSYVTGDIEKAIGLWTKALAMDPSDPKEIQRDLTRAKKISELRK